MFTKYGGSARSLFIYDPATIEAAIERAIRNRKDFGNLLLNSGRRYNEDSHILITINPMMGEDGNLERKSMVATMTSRYIYQKLLDAEIRRFLQA